MFFVFFVWTYIPWCCCYTYISPVLDNKKYFYKYKQMFGDSSEELNRDIPQALQLDLMWKATLQGIGKRQSQPLGRRMSKTINSCPYTLFCVGVSHNFQINKLKFVVAAKQYES